MSPLYRLQRLTILDRQGSLSQPASQLIHARPRAGDLTNALYIFGPMSGRVGPGGNCRQLQLIVSVNSLHARKGLGHPPAW